MAITLFEIGADFQELAKEKLDSELKTFQGNKYGKAVQTYVANALRDFCAKSPQFAETFFKTKRSLSDCVAEIMKGCGNHISDIEVYRRAAKFYFPNSEVNFILTIELTGDEPDEKYLNKEVKKPVEKKEDNRKTVKEKPTEKNKANIIQMTLF